MIGNYYPHFPPRPPTPPFAGQQRGTAPDVPLAQFNAAQEVLDASHLSADGLRVYIEYEFSVRVCYWDEETKRYGSSFPCSEGLPADAVRL